MGTLLESTTDKTEVGFMSIFSKRTLEHVQSLVYCNHEILVARVGSYKKMSYLSI